MVGILIVEDNQDLADLLSVLLVDAGHQVWLAANGALGVQQAQEHRPDVLLLDVELPIMDGPSVARELRKRDRGLERIPIILQSGVPDLPGVASEVGTPYYLPKPYQLDESSRTLARVLEEHTAPAPTGEST